MNKYIELLNDLENYYNNDKKFSHYLYPDEFFVLYSIRHKYQEDNVEDFNARIKLCFTFLDILKQRKINYFHQVLPSFINFYKSFDKEIITEAILIESFKFDRENFTQSINKILDENKDKLDNGVVIYDLNYEKNIVRFYLSDKPLLTFDRYKELHSLITNLIIK